MAISESSVKRRLESGPCVTFANFIVMLLSPALPLIIPLRYHGGMSFANTVVLFVLALLLFGPKKLPGIARQIGKALNEFKRASNEFKAQIEAEINELEFRERQQKREEERKILPVSQPPAGSVQSIKSPGTIEAPPDSASADTVNSPTHDVTNA